MAASTRSDSTQAVQKHSLGGTILLHLGPGLVTAVAAYFLGTWFHNRGLPVMLAFFLTTLAVLFPLLIGIPLVIEKRRTGKIDLTEILQFREPIPAWQIATLSVGALVWSGLVFLLASSALADPLKDWFFARIPDYLDLGYYLAEGAYSRGAVITTWALGILCTTLLAPILEEFYFRGYLLPRLPGSGWWTPLIGVVLFAAYHFWSPWLVLVRVLALLPLVYFVWWKKNIWIGVYGHILLNLVGDTLSAIPVVFQ